MTNPVDAAIAAADKQAQQISQAKDVSTSVALSEQPNGTVQVYQPAKAPTVDDLTSGTMVVDAFLKVGPDGLRIDNKNDLIESVVVKIDTRESIGITAFNGVRFGNPAQYLKTYDGVTCTSGGTWIEAQNRARMVDPAITPYMGADLCMTLAEDAVNMRGAVVSKAGIVLGHSTSITNRKNLTEFIKKLDAQGLRGEVVLVRITSQDRTNPAGNRWGVLKFELLGSVEE